jgi:hypothetical protein
MKLACTVAPAWGDTNPMLHRQSLSLSLQGLRSLGAVRINAKRKSAGPCDMDVRVFPTSPAIRISTSLDLVSKG